LAPPRGGGGGNTRAWRQSAVHEWTITRLWFARFRGHPSRC